MMNGWNGGNMMDGGWGPSGGNGIEGIVSTLIWVAVIVGVIVLVIWLVRQYAGPHTYSTGSAVGGPGAESALDILSKRYARGEIDRNEYEEKRDALRGG